MEIFPARTLPIFPHPLQNLEWITVQKCDWKHILYAAASIMETRLPYSAPVLLQSAILWNVICCGRIKYSNPAMEIFPAPTLPIFPHPLQNLEWITVQKCDWKHILFRHSSLKEHAGIAWEGPSTLTTHVTFSLLVLWCDYVRFSTEVVRPKSCQNTHPVKSQTNKFVRHNVKVTKFHALRPMIISHFQIET